MACTVTIINEESSFGNRDISARWDTDLTSNPSQVRSIIGLNGNSPTQQANGTVIVQRLSGSSNIALKGVNGDTGIPLRGTDPTIFCPLSIYVLTTVSASDLVVVEV